MANNTPHIVGGGLGTFRKEAKERFEAKAKAEQQASNKAAQAALVKSLRK